MQLTTRVPAPEQQRGQLQAMTETNAVNGPAEMLAKTKEQARWDSLTTQQKEAELQPFPAVMELTAEYGAHEVVGALLSVVEFDVEDDESREDVCPCCRARNKRLLIELDQLVTRMEAFEDVINPPAPAADNNADNYQDQIS